MRKQAFRIDLFKYVVHWVVDSRKKWDMTGSFYSLGREAGCSPVAYYDVEFFFANG